MNTHINLYNKEQPRKGGSSVGKTVVPSSSRVIPDIFHPLTIISFTFSDVNLLYVLICH